MGSLMAHPVGVKRIGGLVYVVMREYTCNPHFTPNLNDIANGIQAEYDIDGHGAICDQVLQLRGKSFDYIMADTLIPVEEYEATITASGERLIKIPKIPKWAGPLIVFVIKVVVAAVATVWTVSQLQAILYPPRFCCSVCGDCFHTFSELSAHRRGEHPEEYEENPYECPWCLMQFPDANMLAQHMAECPLRPKEDMMGQLGIIIFLGIILIGAVYLLPKLMAMFKAKPPTPTAPMYTYGYRYKV